MFVGHELKKLKKEYPEIELEPVEVTTDFKRTWNDGIKIFPALKIENEILSGLILTPGRIRRFVQAHLD